MRTVEVEMLAFGKGDMRPVDVPAAEFDGKDLMEQLEQVFYYGQNDFQPKEFPSVSVGDVVHLNGKKYICRMMGFAAITDEDYASHKALDRRDRSFSLYVA